MIESLVPLALPPGFSRRGTVYQSKGRWYTGSLVRFFQGDIQPIGGWVQRTLTGATIGGTPNAAISWQTNDGTAWLAIGTTTHLYVVSSANVVSDITPTSNFSPSGHPVTWQLDTFGSYLMAVYNGANTNPSGYVNLFSWTGDVSNPAQPVGDATEAPTSVYGIVTTPERFLLLLQGNDPGVIGTSATRLYRASRSGAVSADMVD